MQTPESIGLQQILKDALRDISEIIVSIPDKKRDDNKKEKPMTEQDHLEMVLFMKRATVESVDIIGKGIHRPFWVVFKDGYNIGDVSCKVAIFKTIRSVEETKYYKESTDRRVSSPEREIAAYYLDRVLKLDLVPPTTGREILDLGFGSLQAFVRCPLAIDWIHSGYDYRKNLDNEWLHRLAAFDFIIGQLDRHAGNWVMDDKKRVYAIDNGYSFVKNDDRTYLKSNVGKRLYGHDIHPSVLRILKKVDPFEVHRCLSSFGFKLGETEGVLRRLKEICLKKTWDITCGKWARD